ncbi:MAG: hypothetical protein WD492_17320 [Alkalispirochaeta sp.]
MTVVIGGCASTGSGRPVSPRETAPVTAEIPWSGADLQFFEHAVTTLEAERESLNADSAQEIPEPQAPTEQIALGASATLTELVFAVSFAKWDAGRTVLVDTDLLEAQAAARIDRAVLRRRGDSVAGYLDIDSRRLSAALSLHWSGWERVGLGQWRDPASEVEVQIPRSGGWTVSRGAEITTPLEQSITGGAVGRLAMAGSTGVDAVPVIVWARGLTVSGIPPQLLPTRLVLLVGSTETSEDLLVHVALPFGTERDARIATVASRLVMPRFLQEIGVERGPDFSIFRDGDELFIVNVALSLGQVTGLLAESVELTGEESDQ